MTGGGWPNRPSFTQVVDRYVSTKVDAKSDDAGDDANREEVRLRARARARARVAHGICSVQNEKVMVLEVVMLFRVLLSSRRWRAVVISAMQAALLAVPELLVQPPAPGSIPRSSLTLCRLQNPARAGNPLAWAAFASLYVIGGISDQIRVGGRAEVRRARSRG